MSQRKASMVLSRLQLRAAIGGAAIPRGPQNARIQNMVRASSSATTSKTSKVSNHQEGFSSNPNTIKATTALGLAGLSLAAGYAAGNMTKDQKSDQDKDPQQQRPTRVLPSGMPRGCCSCDAPPIQTKLTESQLALPSKLANIVGEENVISGMKEDSTNTTFLKGARLGKGKALAIVQPDSLQDAVKALEAIIEADCVVIPQGQNTGLTGGSVPRDEDNRPTVVMSMKKLDTMFPIDGGTKVVCLAGAGIATLASNLKVWGFENRESHSTLGSTFLNPTTAAGVSLGSGGTQLRKGPAYTDRALYCKVSQNKWGKKVVEVVNTLGIDGIEDTDFPNNSGSVVEQLDHFTHDVKTGYQRPMAKSSGSKNGKAKASDRDYPQIVCDCGDNHRGKSVSRSNADTKGEDCNRSEGKVLILATVHDTFPKADKQKSFWISCQDFDTAQEFRKQVCLDNPKDLPISVEYMDQDSFDVIDQAGRIMANLIKVVGVGSFVGLLWDVKLKIAALPFDGADLFADKLLYIFNNATPAILPSRFNNTGMGHHISMSVGEFGNGEMERCLERMQEFKKEKGDKILIQECENSREEMSLTAFRFVAAPAFRTWCVGNDVQGFSVDYAMPKNMKEAPPLATLADDPNPVAPLKRMRYSHFGCNVVHEDLAYPLGVDIDEVHHQLKHSVSDCGGKLPAEHGHGTEYTAPKDSQNRWMKMDPLNVMNPGIGGLSSKFKYGK